jgi:hypothetical protein
MGGLRVELDPKRAIVWISTKDRVYEEGYTPREALALVLEIARVTDIALLRADEAEEGRREDE